MSDWVPPDDRHLTDGWEPGNDADNLHRRSIEAWIACEKHASSAAGGTVDDRGDLVLVRHPFPSMLLNVCMLRGAVDAERVRDAVRSFFPGGFIVVAPVPVPGLAGVGLGLVGHPPLMIRPPGGTAPAPPPGLEIEEVHDAAGLADFERCIVQGFPLPGAEHWTPRAVWDERSLGGEYRMFVGRVDGEVVAATGGRVAAGLSWVDLVATMPDARRRGHGEAVTWCTTLLDPSLPAGLVSSDDGRPVYARMGYLMVTRFSMWAGDNSTP